MRDSFKFPVGLGMICAGMTISAIQKNKSSGSGYYESKYSSSSSSQLDTTINNNEHNGFYWLCLTLPFINQSDESKLSEYQKEMLKYNRNDYFLSPNFYEFSFLLSNVYKTCNEFWEKYLDKTFRYSNVANSENFFQNFIELNYAIKRSPNSQYNNLNDEEYYCTNTLVERVCDDIEKKFVIARNIKDIYKKWEDEQQDDVTEEKDKMIDRPMFADEIRDFKYNDFNTSHNTTCVTHAVSRDCSPDYFQQPYFTLWDKCNLKDKGIKNDYFKQFTPQIYITWRLSEIIKDYNDYFNEDKSSFNNIDIKMKESILGNSLETGKRFIKLNNEEAIKKYLEIGGER